MMRIMIANFVVLFVSISSFVFAAPSMEIVDLHPEDYEGQTIVWEDSWVSNEVNSDDGVYLLDYVRSEAEILYSGTILSSNGINFVFNRDLADAFVLLELVDGYWYGCTITAAIGQIVDDNGRLYWGAAVSKIEFTRGSGEVYDTLASSSEYPFYTPPPPPPTTYTHIICCVFSNRLERGFFG